MDRIWQWAWDRYGARYSWAIWVIAMPATLPVYLFFSCVIVAFEESSYYVEAAALTVAAMPVLAYVQILPGLASMRVVDQWAVGHDVDRAKALEATYTWGRKIVARAHAAVTIYAALLSVVVGAIAGAPWSRLVQYGVLGAAFGTAVQLVAVHSFVEASLRPARVAIAGDTGIGDSLPRLRPTFAAWSDVAMVATAFGFAIGGAMLAAVIDRAGEVPVLAVAIGCALALGFAVPLTVGAAFSPSLLPIRDLAAGTERVAAGDYSQRLPVVQDDDLGALAASFNRMRAGLAERQLRWPFSAAPTTSPIMPTPRCPLRC